MENWNIKDDKIEDKEKAVERKGEGNTSDDDDNNGWCTHKENMVPKENITKNLFF